MSHTSTIRAIQIQSITALRRAITEMAAEGILITLSEGGKPRAYSANQEGMGVADYVVGLPGCKYDIGLYKTADGKGYEARTDFWNGEVERVLGATPTSIEARDQARMGKLFQRYGVCVAEDAARKQGHMVRRINKPTGVIALEVTGPNL
jgi:hypothetical protein